MELPKAFEEKMKALLGDEFDSYTACYKEPRYYGLRVNTAKISVEEFVRICPFVITPVPWIENGFYYDGEQESPARHPYYKPPGDPSGGPGIGCLCRSGWQSD